MQENRVGQDQGWNGTAGDQVRTSVGNKLVIYLQENSVDQEQETRKEWNCRRSGQNMSWKHGRKITAG